MYYIIFQLDLLLKLFEKDTVLAEKIFLENPNNSFMIGDQNLLLLFLHLKQQIHGVILENAGMQ